MSSYTPMLVSEQWIFGDDDNYVHCLSVDFLCILMLGLVPFDGLQPMPAEHLQIAIDQYMVNH